MNALTRRNFISDREYLLVEQQHSTGLYIQESDASTKIYFTAREVAEAHPNDEFVRFFRLDADMRSAPEEITEEVAAAWLDIHEVRPDEDDLCPAYVTGSDAWEIYRENYRRQEVA